MTDEEKVYNAGYRKGKHDALARLINKLCAIDDSLLKSWQIK